MNPFYKFINWYFRKESLPYWCIFLIDCTICFLSGIFVFALFFKIPKTVANIAPISTTLLFYLFFNILGFRWFHTYSGVIRYSSFVDLKRVAYAMTGSFLAVTLIHYPIIFYPPIHSWILPLNLRHIVSIYIVSTILLWTFRIVIKGIYDTAFDNEKAKRALIYGVKEGGVGLATLPRRNLSSFGSLASLLTRMALPIAISWARKYIPLARNCEMSSGKTESMPYWFRHCAMMLSVTIVSCKTC